MNGVIEAWFRQAGRGLGPSLGGTSPATAAGYTRMLVTDVGHVHI